MAAKIPPQKIADCRELYLRYGGQRHARIVAEMRARGWAGFTKRNLYVRTRNGRVEPGWPERFGWDVPTKHTKSTKKGMSADRSVSRSRRPRVSAVKGRPGIAYANRRTSARERTVLDRPTAFETRKPKFNRQKARRLRKGGDAGKRGRGDGRTLAYAEIVGRTNTKGSVVSDPEVPASPRLALSASHRSLPDSTDSANSPDSTDSANSPDSTDSPDSKDFHSWLKTLPSIWNWDARHQLYLYEHLQKVTDGTCKRLMIFMPPRHGKSELVTVRYTAWRLRQDPSLNVILASYGQDLANRFSRKIKRVLIDDFALSEPPAVAGGLGSAPANASSSKASSPAASTGKAASKPRVQPPATAGGSDSPFPFVRQRPVNRVSEWETTMGGGLRAVGVGAGVTGYGAKLVVIDDPVKSREQANSLRFRNRLWDWFNDDLYTRLEPGGSIVLIQTRWHEDDLAGRLLKDAREGGEEWEVVNLPALAEAANEEYRISNDESKGNEDFRISNIDSENITRSTFLDLSFDIRNSTFSSDPLGRLPGEVLWPEMYGVEHFEEIRRRQGEFSFAALYQQRPVPAEGGTFKREWFKNVVDHAPSGLEWKRGYDLAVSTKQTADYTASFRVAYDKDNNLYIDGGFRRRIGFPEQKRYIAERLTLERDTEHGIELALHGHAVMQELRRDIKVQGRRFTGVRVKGDKQTRALKWQSLAAEGRLRLVRGPWVKAFVEEACSFPHGSHDDQIDAVSLAVSMHDNKGSKLVIF